MTSNVYWLINPLDPPVILTWTSLHAHQRRGKVLDHREGDKLNVQISLPRYRPVPYTVLEWLNPL